MITLALLMLLSQDSNFTERFVVGQSVDLNHGFYICKGIRPSNTAHRIALFRDPRMRQLKAQSLGCQQLKEQKPVVTQVRKVVSAYCGPLVSINDGLMCGREAHQLEVEYQHRPTTVVFLLSEVEFN